MRTKVTFSNGLTGGLLVCPSRVDPRKYILVPASTVPENEQWLPGNEPAHNHVRGADTDRLFSESTMNFPAGVDKAAVSTS